MAVSTVIRDKTAICGVGMTEIIRRSNRTGLQFAVDAFKMALDDAGLKKQDVDGLVVLNWGTDYDRLLEVLGVEARYCHQGWAHGRFLASTIQLACMVVHTGMADCIAIIHGRKGRAYGQPGSDDEMWRQGLGPHGESPAYGAVSAMLGAAFAARRYFHMYGGGNEDLAPIAVALRKHARMNPAALRREPMTLEDHQNSRWVIDPLRLFDCCQINDGGSCILVTSAERARDCKKNPVYIMGMQGLQSGRQSHSHALPGLGVSQQEVYRYEFKPEYCRAFEMAGITHRDVDSLTVYDAFSPYVLFSLERFGFCKAGEAKEFVKGGRIEVGGELPINTSGGLLSEGHLTGWNLAVEVVRQLRGECGERQVKDANVIMWASFHGESIVFRR